MIPPDHPLIGAWLVTFPGEPAANLSLNTFTADGNVIQTNFARPGQGVWTATGDRTAVLTLVLMVPDATRISGTLRVRAELEVNSSGDAYTGRFTTEFIGVDGLSKGEKGPFSVIGGRIKLEAPSPTPIPVQ